MEAIERLYCTQDKQASYLLGVERVGEVDAGGPDGDSCTGEDTVTREG